MTLTRQTIIDAIDFDFLPKDLKQIIFNYIPTDKTINGKSFLGIKFGKWSYYKPSMYGFPLCCHPKCNMVMLEVFYTKLNAKFLPYILYKSYNQIERGFVLPDFKIDYDKYEIINGITIY